MSRSSPLTSGARISRGPFALGVVAVYVLSFASQALLSAPVTAHLGVWAFALVQTALIWLWYMLHVRRLNDAGRPPGIAAGIALVYALEVLLLLIVVWLILSAGFESGGGAREEASLLRLFVFLYLFAMLSADPTIGGLGYWLLGFSLLLLLPIVIALTFSLWVATRPSRV